MLLHHLRHTLRHLQRRPGYTAINVFGLALGLACGVLIILYVLDEVSFDRMHEKADRIYRVEMDVPQRDGTERWAKTLTPVAAAMQETLPGIEQTVRVQGEDRSLVARPGTDTRVYEDLVLVTEPSFFEVFDFPILSGSADALARPNTAFLSESAAQRYFPDENPIGQSISIFDKWRAGAKTYQVVGVIEDMPYNVHLRADIVLSLATELATYDDAWRTTAHTYVLLGEDVSVDALTDRLSAAISNTLDEHFTDGAALALVPLTRIHLYSHASGEMVPQGDIRYVYLFAAIALLVLLIACINYMNLATARAAQRAKEVGVRKVVGAHRGQLIAQFLSESVLLTLLAALLALGLVQLALPSFNTLMDRALTLDLGDVHVWGGLLAVVLGVGLVAGSYPAFALSLFRPAAVLKGSVRVRSLPALRKGLIVFQFAVSVGLIVCTLVIQQQLHFVQHTRLGFDKDQVAVVRTRTALPEASAASFQHALAAQPGVVQVGRASGMPGEPTAITFYAGSQIEDFEGDPPVFDMFWVGPHFASVLGLDMAAGRFFDADRPADEHDAIIVNEAAARALGWEEPLGKTFRNNDGSTRTVVGVVRDFHIKDMRTEIGPAMLQLSPTARRYYAVKFNSADVPALLANLEATWQRFIPDQPFDYSFLDDDFAAMYRTERRLGRLFVAFAVLAICIACLGLFGLTAYMVQQRTKEIGIRKVLGASVSSLLVLFSKNFLTLVAIAFVVAGPLAYVAMHRWLANFAYRAALGWEIFALAGVLVLAIAVATVSIHMVRVARANPVDSLRYE